MTKLEKQIKKSKVFDTQQNYNLFLDKIDVAAQDGKLNDLETSLDELSATNLRRTQTSNQVLLSNMILVGTYWNAIHIALFNGNLDIVRFLMED